MPGTLSKINTAYGKSGEGSWLVDTEGKRYLDFFRVASASRTLGTAVASVLKVARCARPERTNAVIVRGGYHGRIVASAALTTSKAVCGGYVNFIERKNNVIFWGVFPPENRRASARKRDFWGGKNFDGIFAPSRTRRLPWL